MHQQGEECDPSRIVTGCVANTACRFPGRLTGRGPLHVQHRQPGRSRRLPQPPRHEARVRGDMLRGHHPRRAHGHPADYTHGFQDGEDPRHLWEEEGRQAQAQGRDGGVDQAEVRTGPKSEAALFPCEERSSELRRPNIRSEGERKARVTTLRRHLLLCDLLRSPRFLTPITPLITVTSRCEISRRRTRAAALAGGSGGIGCIRSSRGS